MTSVVASAVEFETLSPFRRFYKKWLVNPAVNYWIPVPLMRFYLKHCIKSAVMQESLSQPGSWRVMRCCYENAPGKNWVDRMTVNASALSMGLRNRKKMVASNLRRLFEEKKGEEIFVVGLGSGPAICMIEAIAASPWTGIRALCVDQDDSAFAFGEELKVRHGLQERVRFVKGDAVEAMEALKEEPAVIEAVGLFEYLRDRDIAVILETAGKRLKPGGIFMANSIQPNHGVRHFLERLFGMRLHYRSEADLMRLMENAGFRSFRVEREPLGIYSLVMAEKE